MPEIIGVYEKYSGETQTLSIDYADALGNGETISSASSEIVDENGVDVTATMITGTSISSPYVYPIITGGTAGTKYTLTVSATTSASNIKQAKLTILVS